MRWRTSVSSACCPVRLRQSGTWAAMRAQRPVASSAWASQGKPPSEVRRPPSKVTCSGEGVANEYEGMAEWCDTGVLLTMLVGKQLHHTMSSRVQFNLHE